MNRYEVPHQVNSLARKVPQKPNVEGAISNDCASGCVPICICEACSTRGDSVLERLL